MATTDSAPHESAGHPTMEPKGLEEIRRWRHYCVGAGAAVTAIAAIASVAVYLNVDGLVSQRLEKASLRMLESRAQDAVAKTDAMLVAAQQAAQETLMEMGTLRNASAIEVQALRELWDAELETLDDWRSSGVVYSRYYMRVPVEPGSTLWETNVSTEEYGVAAIGAWQMFRNDSDTTCNYTETVDLFMIRTRSTWRIRVAKPRGCNAVHVGVVYFPTAWVEQVRGEETLERVNQ